MPQTQNGVLQHDDNGYPVAGGVSSSDGNTVLNAQIDPITGRLLVDATGGAGTGTVTDVSVVTANGFAGTVATSTTTPAITITTTTSGILKGNGTAISSATAGTDYTALAFKTISISGSSNVLATTASDTLTLVAGSGVTITGTSSSKSVTIASSASGGTVTSVSVVSANGFAGSVANATTTPAITLSTTTSGILSSDGTAIISAATTGTGKVVLQTSPTILTPTIASLPNLVNNGVVTTTSNAGTLLVVGVTGTSSVVYSTSPTITTATLSGAQQLNEGASIRLDAAGSADGTFSGTTIAITAGTNLAFGDLIYLSATSNWLQTNATNASTSGNCPLGICVSAASTSGASVALLHGNVRADANFPTLTKGAAVYVSTTTSAIQVAQPSSADNVIRVVGFALTTDELLFNPSPDYVTHT